MEESEFRRVLQSTLECVEKAFEDVDPDRAECEQSHGALTIQLSDGSRCILSAQPSVRQLWLALAAKGVAFHFNWDAAADQWVDDKGKGIELLSYLREYLREATGVELRF